MIGRAVLVSVPLDSIAEHGAMWEGPFDERAGERRAHPIARAWALWESIKDDWPEHSATVIANDRARDLAAAYRMSQLGFDYDASLVGFEAKRNAPGNSQPKET